MSTDNFIVETRGNVYLMGLNRTEKLNAFMVWR